MYNTGDLWYEDTMDIYRSITEVIHSVSTTSVQLLHTGIKCRLYRKNKPSTTITPTMGSVNLDDCLACNYIVDIKMGDHVHVTRRDSQEPQAYIVGKCLIYRSPVVGNNIDIGHIEAPLSAIGLKQ